MRTVVRRARREQGSNLVEMALALFVLVFLLIGVADIGRAFHSYITITNAAREGARRASRLPDQGAVIRAAVVQEAANSNVDLVEGDNASITIAASEGVTGGKPISVTVDYTMTTIIAGLVGLPELHMRSSTEMVIFGYVD